MIKILYIIFFYEAIDMSRESSELNYVIHSETATTGHQRRYSLRQVFDTLSSLTILRVLGALLWVMTVPGICKLDYLPLLLPVAELNHGFFSHGTEP